MKKLRHRNDKRLAQGHWLNKFAYIELNAGTLASETALLITILHCQKHNIY